MNSDKPTPGNEPAASQVLAQRIVIRDLTLSCSIGVSDEERARRQRLRLNLELLVDPSPPQDDNINEVLDYGVLAEAVRSHSLTAGCRLLETLAEELAALCFSFPQVRESRIRIEKLDRYADIGGIGIEIERRRDGL
ncbi:dihydroneopterin aldolase [Pelagibius litoralis]|uniref:dihydroneopterin aldolase n=1 Tax=Pelagibius litoralis TaxID=374515 RepID=A0A967KCW0_9PROT|nr:dihydroneopterin aldolase [Pelagibius litoralis]NIA71907.1 dihydroneopterin aldolase [Pelagibius litoralis]